MDRILADRKRLALYLMVWLLLSLLLAALLVEPGRVAFRDAALFLIPPTLIYAFICIAAWYPARALPLRAARAGALVSAHLIAALIWGGVWLLLFRAWEWVLGKNMVGGHAAFFVLTGVLLYLLSVAFHYLLIAGEDARRIELREMEVQVLAREAELKVLKAQLDPHFLFNSLNSISALCGTSPASARTLTTLLAEYLRRSMRAGAAEAITLDEELELALHYLAVERTRFGSRLEIAHDIDDAARPSRIPPLLLLPLVENAVTHGIGQLLDGGEVRIEAKREGDRLRISVENPRDPDGASKRGSGIGLEITRRRIETFFSEPAHIEIENETDRFRVILRLPAHE